MCWMLPVCVAGRRVLDFAAGGGIAAIACARAGAALVEAAEIDDLARAAIRLNAEMNGVDGSVWWRATSWARRAAGTSFCAATFAMRRR